MTILGYQTISAGVGIEEFLVVISVFALLTFLKNAKNIYKTAKELPLWNFRYLFNWKISVGISIIVLLFSL